MRDVAGLTPDGGDYLWVATEGSGLWGGQFEGTNWIRYGADVMDSVFSLLVKGDPLSPKTIYAGQDLGLSISSDVAATWTTNTTANGLADGAVFDVYLAGATLYAAINDEDSDSGGLSFAFCEFC